MMKRVDELAKSCGDDDQHKRPNINELLCKLDEIESEIEMVIRVNGTSIKSEIESEIEMIQVRPFFFRHGPCIGTSLRGAYFRQ